MTTITEYPVRGTATSAGTDTVVFSPAGTPYNLHLNVDADAASALASAPAAGSSGNGTILLRARKVWTVSSGGSFITPLSGQPRTIQGRVTQAESGRLVVQAGVPVLVDLPAQPTSYDLVGGPLTVGSLVNITVFPGASFRPAR